MEATVYQERSHRLSKAIIDHYGHQAFHNANVISFGAHPFSQIEAAIHRLGAKMTVVDARQANLDAIVKNHQFIRTVCADLDNEWPFDGQRFDFVLSLGLMSHLRDPEAHLNRICSLAENIILETEVLDVVDKNLIINIVEEKKLSDLSFNGQGAIVSAEFIQNKLSSINTAFKRKDDKALNHDVFAYDWKETGAGRKYGRRRLYFCRRDPFFLNKLSTVKPAAANMQSITITEHTQQVQRYTASAPIIQPAQEAAKPETAKQTDKVLAWLKIKSRGNVDFVLSNLNYWLGLFSDSSKYDVIIYNEDVPLPNWYNKFRTFRRADLNNNQSCKQIFDRIAKYPFANWWRPAATALAAPYFFLENYPNKIVASIDADDIILHDFSKAWLERALDIIREKSLTTLSYDLNYSFHVLPDNRRFQPHHWSFGVNLADKAKMKDIILKAMSGPIPPDPNWGRNFDYIVGLELEKTADEFLCFTTTAKLLHHSLNNEFHYCKFNGEREQIESNRNGVISFSPKHNRTILIS